jgi:hypothetical protein
MASIEGGIEGNLDEGEKGVLRSASKPWEIATLTRPPAPCLELFRVLLVFLE